jgi:tetratricopeptide (TPR) repeat protein
MATRDRLLLILLVLVAVTSSVFWEVRQHDFIDYDDDYLIYQNTAYSPLTAQSFRDFWTSPQAQIYMPLTYSVWAGLAQIARVTPAPGEKPVSQLTSTYDPGIFHSLSLLLHVLNVLIVFALLRLLVKNDWAAACGALFWALHPVQVESVAWASEMKGVLCGFWGLLALWLYALSSLRWQAGPERDASFEAKGARGRGVGFYFLATLCFVLALLAKPSAVCLPLLAFLLDCWMRRAPRRAIFPLVPWLLLCVPILYMARQGQPMTEQLAPLWTRPLILLDALAFYVGKIVWPFQLSIEYSRSPDWVFERGYLFWTWIVPVGLAALIWWKRRRVPGLVLGGALFVVALLPVSGLIPFVFQYYSTVADRYLYLPLLGFAVALTWFLARYPRRNFFVATGVFLVVLAGLSWRQETFWRDRETLYRQTLALNPRSFQARVNLANILLDRGQEKAAAGLLKAARDVHPKYSEPYVNVGNILLRRGKPKQAINYFVRAAELAPQSILAYFNLGKAYLQIKQYHYALLAFRRAAQLKPEKLETQMLLAETYFRLNREKEGQAALQRTKALFLPNIASYDVNAALIMVRLNRWNDALKYDLDAVKIMPGNAAIHNDIGSILLRLRRPHDAVRVLNNAVKLQPDDAEMRYNLALALTESGQQEQAISQLQQALQIDPNFAPAHQLLQKLDTGTE